MRQPAQHGQKLREGIRIAIRVVLSIGAAMATAIMAAALFANEDAIGLRIAVALFLAVIGWSPLVGHILWSRRHPILAQPAPRHQQYAGPQSTGQAFTNQPFTNHPFTGQPFTGRQGFAPAESPHDGLMVQLHQIRGAAQQLTSRSWIAPHDSAAIDQRIRRLTDLAAADATSQQFGGTASTGLRREVEELHTTVLGLLDAAIESSAVAPGDGDVDDRLAAHLDRLHSTGAAVAELENRLGVDQSGSGV